MGAARAIGGWGRRWLAAAAMTAGTRSLQRNVRPSWHFKVEASHVSYWRKAHFGNSIRKEHDSEPTFMVRLNTRLSSRASANV
jgi:hypothetical protein